MGRNVPGMFRLCVNGYSPWVRFGGLWLIAPLCRLVTLRAQGGRERLLPRAVVWPRAVLWRRAPERGVVHV